MKSFEIRKTFFDFFKKNGHEIVPSSSLIPAQDPTLLFTNAGMNQFKDVFLSKEKRDYTRAVSIQKCIRAGGKHNDLENVGFTKRHLTFFEMMGNFSFGDYFKKEAINYAWDFLTNYVNLPADKLYASVYYLDQESYDIWKNKIKLPENKIYKLGESDNFWQMGDTGPCGPCSEIYIDRGERFGCNAQDCGPGCSCDRFLEIWNLVFMQFDRSANGELKPLKSTGVDTGMGLERLTAILQNKDSVYETDLFWPLIEKIEQLTLINYQEADQNIKSAFKVLADHIRSSSFAIADGALPSNEGRGYVLRKIIRRAALFAQKLSNKNIFPDIAPALIDYMSPIYPELKANSDLIIFTLKSEIDKFAHNLIQGQNILKKYMQESKESKILSGEQAFKLYDTYGFPLELTKVIAQENSFEVDLENFDKLMEKQKIRSGKKEASICSIDQNLYTHFTGYDEHISAAKITALVINNKLVQEIKAGTSCYIITDKSPFYVECGGQVSDQGYIKVGDKQIPLLGLKKFDSAIGAFIESPVDLKVGETVLLAVDSPSRINTMKNHTATHLLQAALIEVISKQIKQSGSVVEPDYLRFDFTYHENLTSEQIKQVENLVNKKILENIPVKTEYTTLKNALDRGVIAFFGEKYKPEKVRIVEIPGFSSELCGGTHVKATGDIGVFKIIEISALSAGNKRIVALTGPKALEQFQQNFNTVKILSQEFKVPQNQVLEAVKKQKEQLRLAQSEIKNLKSNLYKLQIPAWSNQVELINSVPFLYLSIDNLTSEDLKDITAALLKIKPAVYFLLSKQADKYIFFVATTEKLASKINFKDFANWLRQQGLQGGGKETTLQGGATTINANLKNQIKNWLKENIK